jgi:hypothetical protein
MHHREQRCMLAKGELSMTGLQTLNGSELLAVPQRMRIL